MKEDFERVRSSRGDPIEKLGWVSSGSLGKSSLGASAKEAELNAEIEREIRRPRVKIFLSWFILNLIQQKSCPRTRHEIECGCSGIQEVLVLC